MAHSNQRCSPSGSCGCHTCMKKPCPQHRDSCSTSACTGTTRCSASSCRCRVSSGLHAACNAAGRADQRSVAGPQTWSHPPLQEKAERHRSGCCWKARPKERATKASAALSAPSSGQFRRTRADKVRFQGLFGHKSEE